MAAGMISAHEMIQFLFRQETMTVAAARAMPDRLIVQLDDEERQRRWSLIYWREGRNDPELLCTAPWARDDEGSGGCNVSLAIADRVVRSHLAGIIAELRKDLALRERLDRDHRRAGGNADCELLREHIRCFEEWPD